eukprot:TRINITY_DN1803_c0_g1_i1.p1 TRINITY_DN1803_c0_g1~~TRINITY_DN1803_c0_g1_i1.p1  ORF type:complete len:235 (-),score=62.72 TRINITY_DN1803_c0_g1_i1:465-1169(-)
MAENMQVMRNIAELSDECEKHKKTANDLSVEADKLRMGMKKLTVQFNQRQEDVNKLLQNNKVMDQEIKDQANYISKVHSDNNRLCAENSQLKKLQDDCTRENAQLWEQNRGFKSQLNETKGIIEMLSGEEQVIKKHRDELMKENENLRQFVEELKRKLEESVENSGRVVQEYEMTRNHENKKMQNTLEENRRLKEEVAKLKVDKEKLKVMAGFILVGRDECHNRSDKSSQRGKA